MNIDSISSSERSKGGDSKGSDSKGSDGEGSDQVLRTRSGRVFRI